MTNRVMVLVGTTKGAFFFYSDSARQNWQSPSWVKCPSVATAPRAVTGASSAARKGTAVPVDKMLASEASTPDSDLLAVCRTS